MPPGRSLGSCRPPRKLVLQELQKENTRLKRLVADQPLDNQILREVGRPNY